jgi:hypothetical protein
VVQFQRTYHEETNEPKAAAAAKIRLRGQGPNHELPRRHPSFPGGDVRASIRWTVVVGASCGAEATATRHISSSPTSSAAGRLVDQPPMHVLLSSLDNPVVRAGSRLAHSGLHRERTLDRKIGNPGPGHAGIDIRQTGQSRPAFMHGTSPTPPPLANPLPMRPPPQSVYWGYARA